MTKLGRDITEDGLWDFDCHCDNRYKKLYQVGITMKQSRENNIILYHNQSKTGYYELYPSVMKWLKQNKKGFIKWHPSGGDDRWHGERMWYFFDFCFRDLQTATMFKMKFL